MRRGGEEIRACVFLRRLSWMRGMQRRAPYSANTTGCNILRVSSNGVTVPISPPSPLHLPSILLSPPSHLLPRYGFAVVDLPRTFDPSDASLYRLQIEPSPLGSTLIAETVMHCLTKHDFNGPSVL